MAPDRRSAANSYQLPLTTPSCLRHMRPPRTASRRWSDQNAAHGGGGGLHAGASGHDRGALLLSLPGPGIASIVVVAGAYKPGLVGQDDGLYPVP